MRKMLIRILKHGLPTALALALIGFGLGQAAGIWVQRQTIERPGMETVPYPSPTSPTHSEADHPADAYRNRLPIVMAVMGFGLVVIFELLVFMVRGDGPTLQKEPKLALKDSTEELLNQLLDKAEAAEARRKFELSHKNDGAR